jgi:hypothetical protein
MVTTTTMLHRGRGRGGADCGGGGGGGNMWDGTLVGYCYRSRRSHPLLYQQHYALGWNIEVSEQQ